MRHPRTPGADLRSLFDGLGKMLCNMHKHHVRNSSTASTKMRGRDGLQFCIETFRAKWSFNLCSALEPWPRNQWIVTRISTTLRFVAGLL